MRKKVLFSINTFLVGGIEKALIELLKNDELKKYDLTLLIGYNLGDIQKLKNQIPEHVEIKYILEDEIYTKAKRKKALGTLSKVEKILDESISWLKKITFKKRLLQIIKNYDVLIDYDMTLASYAKEISIKKIAYCHFSLKHYNRGIKSRQDKLGKRLSYYDKVVVISEDMKKEAEMVFPYLKNKLVKIYNSFNLDEIERKSQICLDEEKVYLEDKYILAVGRLEETQKDFTSLLSAYSLIHEKIDEKLYIIGDGRHREQLEKHADNLKIKNKVVFLGFKNNPYVWMRNSSLFVHSSKFEGLPTVLIEALILGVPIVATDCPTGPREILEDGQNGVLTKVGDVKALAEGIEKIILNKDIKKQYLLKSKESVKRFDGKVVIKQLEGLF